MTQKCHGALATGWTAAAMSCTSALVSHVGQAPVSLNELGVKYLSQGSHHGTASSVGDVIENQRAPRLTDYR